jgi:lipid-binding SYLF domain-containing protein
MHNPSFSRPAKMAAIAMTLGLATLGGSLAQAAGSASLDKSVMSTLAQCRQISTSCSASADKALGLLVFPSVVKADLLVGGAGGEGALVENGKITGYYKIGAITAGLQAGIEKTSQVYAFQTAQSLAELKNGPDWKVGASAGVTVVEADANARGATGNVLAYIFDAKGLHAGISVDAFDVWKSGEARPS